MGLRISNNMVDPRDQEEDSQGYPYNYQKDSSKKKGWVFHELCTFRLRFSLFCATGMAQAYHGYLLTLYIFKEAKIRLSTRT
jgi:hypothetical protein